jgi:hypothetical protein
LIFSELLALAVSSSSSLFWYLYMHFYVTDITDSYSNVTCLSSITARKQQNLESYFKPILGIFRHKVCRGAQRIMMHNSVSSPTQLSLSLSHATPSPQAVMTKSEWYNCFIGNGRITIPKRSCTEAKGSNSTVRQPALGL